MKPRSFLLPLLALVVVVFAAAYFGSPWWVADDLMRAARAGDDATVEAHVDLPAVRASLKNQLDSRLAQSLDKPKSRDDAMAELGSLVGRAVIDKTIDVAVTPAMLAEALRTARAPRPGKTALAPPEDAADAPPKLKVTYGLTGLNRFEARLSPADRPSQHPLILGLTRRGLFDWKLTDIILPD
jgi:hypothetical protein